MPQPETIRGKKKNRSGTGGLFIYEVSELGEMNSFNRTASEPSLFPVSKGPRTGEE